MQSSQNNPEKSYTEKKAIHEPSGWSMFIRCSFDKKENKLNYYRGKDYIGKLCKKIKESANEIINRETNRNDTIKNKEIKSYEKQKVCYICEKEFCNDKIKKVNMTFMIK